MQSNYGRNIVVKLSARRGWIVGASQSDHGRILFAVDRSERDIAAAFMIDHYCDRGERDGVRSRLGSML